VVVAVEWVAAVGVAEVAVVAVVFPTRDLVHHSHGEVPCLEEGRHILQVVTCVEAEVEIQLVHQREAEDIDTCHILVEEADTDA
jgi:hypothetical protein